MARFNPYMNFTPPHIEKEQIRDAHHGAWKGLAKGMLIGLAVGVGMYFAGVGLAALNVPIISSALAAKGLSAFSTVGLIGFAAFNSIFFGVSGAINGAVQENTLRKAEERTNSLEAKINQLEIEQSKDNALRQQLMPTLTAYDNSAQMNRTVQGIIAGGARGQGNFAKQIEAERELAATQEAAR